MTTLLFVKCILIYKVRENVRKFRERKEIYERN